MNFFASERFGAKYEVTILFMTFLLSNRRVILKLLFLSFIVQYEYKIACFQGTIT